MKQPVNPYSPPVPSTKNNTKTILWLIFGAGCMSVLVIAIITIVVLTIAGQSIKNQVNATSPPPTAVSSTNAEIENNVKVALNDRFELNGSPVRCTSVSLRENRPGHYVGSGNFTDNSTLKLDVSMNPDGTFVWQALP